MRLVLTTSACSASVKNSWRLRPRLFALFSAMSASTNRRRASRLSPVIDGDAYADPESALVAVIEDRFAHPADDAVGEHLQLICLGIPPTDDNKLIAPDAGDEILRADGGLQHV